MKKKKSLTLLSSIWLVLVLVTILFIAARAKSEPARTPKLPIKIGALLSLTGPMAEMGPACEKGIVLKLDEVGWEVAGRKIELIKEDDAADPVVALDKARKLVEFNKTDVILGPLNTACSLAVAKYLTPFRTPQITHGMYPIEGHRFGGNNIFSVPGTMKGNTYPGGTFAYDKLGYRTATVLHTDYVAGEDFCQGFIDAFESKGGVIVQRQRIPIPTIDFATYLATLKKADCVAFWFFPGQGITFVKQYFGYGLKIPLFAVSSINLSDPMMEAMGDLCLGMVTCTSWSRQINTAVNRRFVDAWVKKYKEYPGFNENAWGYESAAIFLEAVKATGGDSSPKAIINAMLKLKVDIPSGTISFTPEGLPVRDLYLCKANKKDGEYVLDVIGKFSQILLKAPTEK